jgi:uncharacterized membrane protein YeaQ/YmgE (transglycosylase-associated protein family)
MVASLHASGSAHMVADPNMGAPVPKYDCPIVFTCPLPSSVLCTAGQPTVGAPALVPSVINGRLEPADTMLMAIVVGLVLATMGKLVLGPRSSLSWPASILSGIVGAGIGAPIARWLFDGSGWGMGLFSVLATIATLMIAERWRRRDVAIADLLAAGEGGNVEFKSSARANLANNGVRDDRMEQVIAKTVAGFLNSHGGVLLVGVDDQANPLGLAPDLALMKSPDLDRYELWLRDLLVTTLGATAAANVRVEFPRVDGVTICALRVPASARPVFLRAKGKPPAFLARVGNSTRELPVDEALAYVANHWRIGLGSRLGRVRS